jgi:hypothetical protein
VFADGKLVGRIMEEGSRFGPPELRWGWSITAIVPATPPRRARPAAAAPPGCCRLPHFCTV